MSFAGLVYGQHNEDIISQNKVDSIAIQSIQKADSIALSFQTSVDSVSSVYYMNLSHIDSINAVLQTKLDSLQQLQLTTQSITKKIDSLNQVKQQKLQAVTQKLEQLKTKSTQSLDQIQLPPQLHEPMQKLKSSIDGYTLPTLSDSGFKLPAADLPGLGKFELPTLSKQLNLGDNFGKLNEITNSAGGYAKDAQQLVQGNLSEVKNIDKTIEAEALKMDGVSQLQQGANLFPAQSLDSAALAEKATDIVKEQVVAAVQDHFAGKEEVLQQAMAKMTKLKSRYSEVKSFAELPKRLPNPLKGKPFIERIVPGISFQMMKTNYLLLDVAPMLMYRISPRISAGAGWNERLTIGNSGVYSEQRIYGPRAAFEFKWTEGISLRFLPELMNTTIPPYAAQVKGINDPAYRTWIAGLFVGIKKDFKVYKKIEGNTELLYNLYDPDNMSPYVERFTIRFGFEFPMTKKSATVK
jgi:hypothetical protein